MHAAVPAVHQWICQGYKGNLNFATDVMNCDFRTSEACDHGKVT